MQPTQPMRQPQPWTQAWQAIRRLSHGSGLTWYLSIMNLRVPTMAHGQQSVDSTARQHDGHDDSQQEPPERQQQL